MWRFGVKKRPGTGRRRRPEESPRPAPPKTDDELWDELGPDWRRVSDWREQAEAKARLWLAHRTAPFASGAFQYVAYGELPDPFGSDKRVEAILWRLHQHYSYGGSSHELISSGVSLWFPCPLPAFALHPKSQFWGSSFSDFPWTPKTSLYSYGADWARPGRGETNAMADDHRTAQALIRPEVLALPQLSGRHWRLYGNLAVAWSRSQSHPRLLAELAVELCEVIGAIPPDVMAAAALRAPAPPGCFRRKGKKGKSRTSG